MKLTSTAGGFGSNNHLRVLFTTRQKIMPCRETHRGGGLLFWGGLKPIEHVENYGKPLPPELAAMTCVAPDITRAVVGLIHAGSRAPVLVRLHTEHHRSCPPGAP